MENDGSLVSVTEIRKDELILIIAQFILAFGVMVFLHELGHFLAGKLFKVEIEEFGIGLPPRMIKLFTWRGTLFSLNWLPFGAL
jgi:regulator of sigma E protease